MIEFMYGFGIFMAVFTVAMVWAFHCNNKTYDQRKRILKAISRADVSMQRELYVDWDDAEYNHHFRALLFFQNPYRLYSNAIMGLPNVKS